MKSMRSKIGNLSDSDIYKEVNEEIGYPDLTQELFDMFYNIPCCSIVQSWIYRNKNLFWEVK